MDSQPSQSGRSPIESPTLARTNSSSLHKSNSDASIQSLSSILNNPHVGKSGVYGSDASWVGWWSSSTTVTPPEFAPLVSTKASSEVTRSDFQNYLAPIAEPYNRFEDIRKHSSKENVDLESIGGQGEALVACLREVPALYFKEDFQLEDGATFRAACPFSNVSENLVLQEKLSHYLDVVELHLVKEISLRSNSFFEAQGQLQDLNVKIVEGCNRIRELKETIRLLDVDLVDSARQIQELSATRTNLLALQQKLRLILYVNQAVSALKLLVASADCAGALDVTDDLQNLLDGDELTGLHCFRHLRDHVAGSIESINSILSAEFIRASIHDAAERDVIILSKSKARASLPMNGTDDEVKLDEEEMSNFRDRLLPTVIGLLRTAKLPSVLRIYRDTVTADMKSAIKTAVAELLPVLAARPLDSEFSSKDRAVDTDGGGASLASKLRSLSSDCFVQLLSAIFLIVQAHLVRAAEVKKAIEWILSNLDGHYAADSVAAAVAHGAATVEAAQERQGRGISLSPYSPQRQLAKVLSFPGKAIDGTSSSNMSKNFRADVLRENAEAVFAACDAAHGRWAKLLGVRAVLHPKLRLQEFLTIYNITQEFITATEKIGGRLGYSIRGTLQSQAKAFVDFQHESRMAKIKAVLDQETWVEIDVPEEFQSIVSVVFSSENLDGSDGDNSTNYDDAVTNNEAETGVSNAEQQDQQINSVETSTNNAAIDKSRNLVGAVEKKPHSKNLSAQSNNTDEKDHKKPASLTLFYKGVNYHMVNCGLILLKMLSEYIDINNFLPMLSSEVVHRVVEILKFFNTRTCQLVLGAGAMQVSGLKSITSKHLALASQVISFIHAIIPEIRQILFLKVPETRKALLLSEIDRVAQVYAFQVYTLVSRRVVSAVDRVSGHPRRSFYVTRWPPPLVNSDGRPPPSAVVLRRVLSSFAKALTSLLVPPTIRDMWRSTTVVKTTAAPKRMSYVETVKKAIGNGGSRREDHKGLRGSTSGVVKHMEPHTDSSSSEADEGEFFDEASIVSFFDNEEGLLIEQLEKEYEEQERDQKMRLDDGLEGVASLLGMDVHESNMNVNSKGILAMPDEGHMTHESTHTEDVATMGNSILVNQLGGERDNRDP
ncbi:vacuolar protein sorting-associated protein 54, chloroplastic isoform X1 [Senna tora]|uniref:Vacuolar protein sorting-associated protein 54, chloroplastic isoform X1 n=1 Tax=Senna tora TaxID=362788 RepID=A0A834SNB9_9FABA|nr:vacuolar protein sorting-associated protein 54, chloroplastic isoform X1 [Senna tora]